MAPLNLKSLSAAALTDLLRRIDAVLPQKVRAERKALEDRLRKLDGFGGPMRRGGGRHPLKGKKVAPKYRGPEGETWTGRGLKPKWLGEALKGGKKIEDFLIANGGRKAKRK